MILVALLPLTLSACGAFSTSIRTEEAIDAPVDVVWDVLADFSSYPEWNPYHVAMAPRCVQAPGELRVHDTWRVQIHKPDGERLTLPVRVIAATRHEELTWGGGVPGVFSGEHRFLLQRLDDGRTLLRHDEDFSGVVLPFVPLRPAAIEEGYRLVNAAARRRAEAIWAASRASCDLPRARPEAVAYRRPPACANSPTTSLPTR